jgi:DNA replication protein DnaC
MDDTKNSNSKPTYRQIMEAEKPHSITYGEDSPAVTAYKLKLRIEASGIPWRHLLALDALAGQLTDTATRYGQVAAQLRSGVPARKIIALLGIRGTGKTQLATAAAVEAIEAGKVVRYRKAADLFREIRAHMKDGGDDATVKAMASCWLLVLDEAHERADTEFENRTLISIIDKRYDNMLPTLFISNDTKKEFGARMGNSIVSRMLEVGEVIECDWASFRSKTK